MSHTSNLHLEKLAICLSGVISLISHYRERRILLREEWIEVS
jgi:hypothetical protein